MAGTAHYVLGHSDSEMERLATQARTIDPITRRFLTSAGITRGMRVLDVGSGAGDVAMMLGEMVGPEGEVVGSDLALTAVKTATRRARDRGFENIRFTHGDPADMTFARPFDAVVGRYVLQFMSDPAATLAKLATHVSHGGIVFFHELDWDGARSAPSVPTYDRACKWISQTIERSFAQSRLGPRLASLYRKAGLASASMQLEAVIASGPAAIDAVRLVTDLVVTLLSTMERLGVVASTEVDVATLADRILAEVGADATLIGRTEVAAWART